MYAKKNTCPVCDKKLVFVKVIKTDGKTTHVAIHEGDALPENGTAIHYNDISHTYRKRLRDALHKNDVNVVAKPVFDATGMNRFNMVADVISVLKDGGMSDVDAEALRAKMLAKGCGFVEDIKIAEPYITIVRNLN